MDNSGSDKLCDREGRSVELVVSCTLVGACKLAKLLKHSGRDVTDDVFRPLNAAWRTASGRFIGQNQSEQPLRRWNRCLARQPSVLPTVGKDAWRCNYVTTFA